ncbi:hypothetical protein LP416_29800 [Polaromonas sp. P2-4]|nr:hypothetical protein LP416_29800 [Polaromonas sp. P2-4]
MMTKTFQSLLAAAAILVSCTAGAQDKAPSSTWQDQFGISNCNLVTQGRNQYTVLEPGFQLVLEGGDTKVQITVLDETKTVDGVTTRGRGERMEERRAVRSRQKLLRNVRANKGRVLFR